MKHTFVLNEIDQFDARKGYTRWVLPGVGISSPGMPKATVDIWRNREGRLFTRFNSAGYVYHYEIISANQKSFGDDMKQDIENFLFSMLDIWVCEGIDVSVLEGL